MIHGDKQELCRLRPYRRGLQQAYGAATIHPPLPLSHKGRYVRPIRVRGDSEEELDAETIVEGT
jgi:hypothetical protein